MRKSRTTRSTSLVMTSVAFQDHISRSWGLRDPGGSRSGSGGEGPEPRRLTLAQRRGLVPAPPPRLSRGDWVAVESLCRRHGDSTLPCAICREEFHLQPQLLLCCSHVFHRSCLRAYESASGRKCCPLCRKQPYETRAVDHAARLCRQTSATRIQACWRGYLARRWYRQVRKTTPPRDTDLRRKFFEVKLQELTSRLLRCCQIDVDGFLRSVDLSLTSSRRVFQQLEAGPRGQDWASVLEQVEQRGTTDCPICLTPVPGRGQGSASGRGGAVLLSCSHVFHPQCLDALERFSRDHAPCCPVCRARYRRRAV